MDILKEKTFETFDYPCRYTPVPYYYNVEDGKYIYGIGTQLDKNLSYVAHQVRDSDTLESLALRYYNNPTLYWMIAMYNDILDSFEKLSERFSMIKIPNMASIYFGDDR